MRSLLFSSGFIKPEAIMKIETNYKTLMINLCWLLNGLIIIIWWSNHDISRGKSMVLLVQNSTSFCRLRPPKSPAPIPFLFSSSFNDPCVFPLKKNPRMGVFLKGAYPNSWMVYKGKIPLKWKPFRGTPIYGNPHIHHFACYTSAFSSGVPS